MTEAYDFLYITSSYRPRTTDLINHLIPFLLKAELLIHVPETKLAEGPVWDHRDQSLWWVDIPNGKLYQYRPDSQSHTSYAVGHALGAAVPREQGGFVLALANGFAFFDPQTETLKSLVDPEEDLPHNRFNDGKVDPAGRFWAGTMDTQEKDQTGSLYCLSPGTLQVDRVLVNLSISNGLAWTRDVKTMYFIDSPTQCVQAFDFDLEGTLLSNRREVLHFDPAFGTPDGMTIDGEDRLWIAFWEGSKVACFDPISGKQLDQIDIPARRITSCTFGGEKWDTLYITSAAKEGDPLGGAIFKASPGVQGSPVTLFKG